MPLCPTAAAFTAIKIMNETSIAQNQESIGQFGNDLGNGSCEDNRLMSFSCPVQQHSTQGSNTGGVKSAGKRLVQQHQLTVS